MTVVFSISDGATRDPSLYVSVAAFAVSLAGLAFSLFKGRYDLLTGVRPAIVFVFDGHDGWVIQNVGAGPAMNIVVAVGPPGLRDLRGAWTDPVQVPPIKAGSQCGMSWDPENNTNSFSANYEDMWGRCYSTTCSRDKNIIRRKRLKGQWVPGTETPLWRKPETHYQG